MPVVWTTLGLSYKEDTIETGLLKLSSEFHLRKRTEDYNEKIMELSKDRASFVKMQSLLLTRLRLKSMKGDRQL